MPWCQPWPNFRVSCCSNNSQSWNSAEQALSLTLPLPPFVSKLSERWTLGPVLCAGGGCVCVCVREYWIYRGPGWFYSTTPLSPPLPSAICLSFSVCLCVAGPAYWGDRGRGWAWSRIIRQQRSLALYKSFNTLWCVCVFRLSLPRLIFLCPRPTPAWLI
jgi:hypothetical protein